MPNFRAICPGEAFVAHDEQLYSASEQLFFLGKPVAHVVAYEEWLREARRRKISAPLRSARLPELL